jgi:adenylate cyclase class IV
MHYSMWRQNDGYYECIASFHDGTTPILRLRAVLNSNGSYDVLLRDTSGSGKMLAYKAVEITDITEAKKEAYKLCFKYLTGIVKVFLPVQVGSVVQDALLNN